MSLNEARSLTQPRYRTTHMETQNEEKQMIIELNDTVDFYGVTATCIGIFRFKPPLETQIGFLFPRAEERRIPDTPDLVLTKTQLETMLANGIKITQALPD